MIVGREPRGSRYQVRGQRLALEIGDRQSRDGDQAVKRPQARAYRGDERFFLGRRVRYT